MKVGRGFALVLIAVVCYAAMKLNQPSEIHSEPGKVPLARMTSAPEPPKNDEPFVATPDNEYRWRADLLPVDWPKFTVVPNKPALASKTTDQKLQAAQAVVNRHREFKQGTLKSPPPMKETSAAVDQLLTIKRSDPKFSEAWALFIDARVADRASAEYERDLKERKNRGVSIGMTAEQVLQSNWGKPQRVNETLTAGRRHEQWVYGGSNYLYLENGILRSIQMSK